MSDAFWVGSKPDDPGDCPTPGCPGENIWKVIYFGLPHTLCDDCSLLDGPFIEITGNLPFNGMLMVYEDSYWAALWRWLKGDHDV